MPGERFELVFVKQAKTVVEKGLATNERGVFLDYRQSSVKLMLNA